MNIKRSISFLIFCLIFQVFGLSQDQIKILDQSSKILGRFKTQLFQVEGPKLKQLRGTSPKIKATGEEQELILRLEELKWFDENNNNITVNVNRSEIKLSDSKNLKLSSDRTTFSLSADSKIASDIKFKVYTNGNYTISIPFSAGDISSRFVQSFSVEAILPSEPANPPIGEIADVKKAWKEVDKKDSQAIKDFITQYQDNEIAVNEGLIVIADRSLKRLGNSEDSESSDVSEERDQFVTTSTRELGPMLLTRRDHNIFNLDLSGLGEVDIDLSDSDEIEVFNNGGNVYDLKIKGSKSYTISVTEISTGVNYEFILNNEFRAKMDMVDKDFLFSIEGGVSPFTVEFYKPDENFASVDAQFSNVIPDVANQITITNQQLSFSGMDGNYEKVVIRDFTTEAFATFPISLVVTPQKGMSKLLLVVLALLILTGGGVMFYFNKKKNTKRNEYLARAKAIQAQQKAEMQAQAAAYSLDDNPSRNSEESKPARKITINKPEKSVVPSNGGGKSTFISSGKMKITKRAGKRGSLTLEEFNTVLKEDSHAFMDLQEIWPDTAIKELYLGKECIKALGAFLKEENLDKAIVEMEGAIPEVGGFLMGNYNVDEATGFIRVTMDEFVPFVPEYHDVFKIEIGTQTLVQELGDAQDTHPDKDVIGWFHTHPGHGLFLSNSDLSVQRHFPHKFQIAMEIDSLTPALDTAFFTRKQNGTINNVEHRKQGAKWFSWKKIEKI